jgi:hypothetical protein
MRIVEAANAPDWNARSTALAGVASVKTLLEGAEDTPGNYRMNFGSAEEGWDVPRHRHNFDQMRFPISGEFEYLPGKILPAGWVGYFPEGVWYGPQTRRTGLLMLLLQFGGASGGGYLSKRQRRGAMDALEQKGHFEKGTLQYIDREGRSVDEYQAFWNEIRGTEFVYPAPRYNDLVLMNPESFAWIPQSGAAGIAYKWLGTFTERKTRVAFVRAHSGATLTINPGPSTRLLFMSKGSASHDGRDYAKYTAFSIEPTDAAVAMKAVEDAEFFYIELPELEA